MMVHQGASLDARCQVTFMGIADKCLVADPHHGNQATRPMVVVLTEAAPVTDPFVGPLLRRLPHLRMVTSVQKSALATPRVLAFHNPPISRLVQH